MCSIYRLGKFGFWVLCKTIKSFAIAIMAINLVALSHADDLVSPKTDYAEVVAVLAWQGDVAILTVNTMMGLDTIEEINAAYAQIADRETDALIINLRENGGGAFAIHPLVSHLLTKLRVRCSLRKFMICREAFT